jgi:hypothetical protein
VPFSSGQVRDFLPAFKVSAKSMETNYFSQKWAGQAAAVKALALKHIPTTGEQCRA